MTNDLVLVATINEKDGKKFTNYYLASPSLGLKVAIKPAFPPQPGKPCYDYHNLDIMARLCEPNF